jgi:hypothetical protein
MVRHRSLEEILDGRKLADIDPVTERRLLRQVCQAAQKDGNKFAAAQANEALGKHYDAGVWYRKAGQKALAFDCFVTAGRSGDRKGTEAALKALIHQKQHERAKELYLEQQAGHIDLLKLVADTGISFSERDYQRIADGYVQKEREWHPDYLLGGVGYFLLSGCAEEGLHQEAVRILRHMDVPLTEVYSGVVNDERVRGMIEEFLTEEYNVDMFVEVFGYEAVAEAYVAKVVEAKLPATKAFSDKPNTEIYYFEMGEDLPKFLSERMKLPEVGEHFATTYEDKDYTYTGVKIPREQAVAEVTKAIHEYFEAIYD